MFQKKAHSDHVGSTGAPEPSASTPIPEARTQNPAPAPSSGAATVLAEGSKFVGKANVSGTIRVEGHAEGEIEAADSIVVGKSGDVQAKVAARRAVVNGRFHGEIAAREGVEFQSGSQVEADVKAKNMVMEDGVSFRGNCEIGN